LAGTGSWWGNGLFNLVSVFIFSPPRNWIF
jgi:hypothetical protein